MSALRNRTAGTMQTATVTATQTGVWSHLCLEFAAPSLALLIEIHSTLSAVVHCLGMDMSVCMVTPLPYSACSDTCKRCLLC